MLLGQALTQLKNLKSKAARTDTYIESSTVFYEDAAPDHIYLEEVANRSRLNEEIIRLKVRIQLTNAVTTVSYDDQLMTLTELILRNASLRANMAWVARQMNHSINSDDRWSSARKKDELKKVYADGYDKGELKKMLEKLEKEKEALEAVLANANAITTLMG